MTDPASPGLADAPQTQTGPAVNPHDTAFFGHPRGLSALFFTEMWERFSYYGMRALLLLYMTADVRSGGLGFSAAVGGPIYGLFTSMAYMMALPGGWVADRLIGQRRAVLYGGILIAAGNFGLAIPSSSLATFYLGLFLIVCGTGLLKGNVSVIVGQLYRTGRRAARLRVLDLLHGHQPRRLHRAADLRISGPEHRLAPRLRGVGRRHAARPRCNTCSAAGIWATPARSRSRPSRRRRAPPCAGKRCSPAARCSRSWRSSRPAAPWAGCRSRQYRLRTQAACSCCCSSSGSSAGCTSSPTGRPRNASVSTWSACCSSRRPSSGRCSSRPGPP